MMTADQIRNFVEGAYGTVLDLDRLGYEQISKQASAVQALAAYRDMQEGLEKSAANTNALKTGLSHAGEFISRLFLGAPKAGQGIPNAIHASAPASLPPGPWQTVSDVSGDALNRIWKGKKTKPNVSFSRGPDDAFRKTDPDNLQLLKGINADVRPVRISSPTGVPAGAGGSPTFLSMPGAENLRTGTKVQMQNKLLNSAESGTTNSGTTSSRSIGGVKEPWVLGKDLVKQLDADIVALKQQRTLYRNNPAAVAQLDAEIEHLSAIKRNTVNSLKTGKPLSDNNWQNRREYQAAVNDRIPTAHTAGSVPSQEAVNFLYSEPVRKKLSRNDKLRQAFRDMSPERQGAFIREWMASQPSADSVTKKLLSGESLGAEEVELLRGLVKQPAELRKLYQAAGRGNGLKMRRSIDAAINPSPNNFSNNGTFLYGRPKGTAATWDANLNPEGVGRLSAEKTRIFADEDHLQRIQAARDSEDPLFAYSRVASPPRTPAEGKGLVEALAEADNAKAPGRALNLPHAGAHDRLMNRARARTSLEENLDDRTQLIQDLADQMANGQVTSKFGDPKKYLLNLPPNTRKEIIDQATPLAEQIRTSNKSIADALKAKNLPNEARLLRTRIDEAQKNLDKLKSRGAPVTPEVAKNYRMMEEAIERNKNELKAMGFELDGPAPAPTPPRQVAPPAVDPLKAPVQRTVTAKGVPITKDIQTSSVYGGSRKAWRKAQKLREAQETAAAQEAWADGVLNNAAQNVKQIRMTPGRNAPKPSWEVEPAATTGDLSSKLTVLDALKGRKKPGTVSSLDEIANLNSRLGNISDTNRLAVNKAQENSRWLNDFVTGEQEFRNILQGNADKVNMLAGDRALLASGKQLTPEQIMYFAKQYPDVQLSKNVVDNVLTKIELNHLPDLIQRSQAANTFLQRMGLPTVKPGYNLVGAQPRPAAGGAAQGSQSALDQMANGNVGGGAPAPASASGASSADPLTFNIGGASSGAASGNSGALSPRLAPRGQQGNSTVGSGTGAQPTPAPAPSPAPAPQTTTSTGNTGGTTAPTGQPAPTTQAPVPTGQPAPQAAGGQQGGSTFSLNVDGTGATLSGNSEGIQTLDSIAANGVQPPAGAGQAAASNAGFLRRNAVPLTLGAVATGALAVPAGYVYGQYQNRQGFNEATAEAEKQYVPQLQSALSKGIEIGSKQIQDMGAWDLFRALLNGKQVSQEQAAKAKSLAMQNWEQTLRAEIAKRALQYRTAQKQQEAQEAAAS